MDGSSKGSIYLTQYVRRLRGGSQPILARASDGLLYVVKFANNLQGQNLLFNESIGSELFRVCGLGVPSWRPIVLGDEFLDKNRGCWIQTPEGTLRPETGVCFGSRFLESDEGRILEILPGSSFHRLRDRKQFWLAWLLDACAEHADNRQAIFLEDARGGLQTYFIDHGHLFGGASGEQHAPLRASRYLDSRIYPDVSSNYLMGLKRVAESLDTEKLWRSIGDIPDCWKTSSAVEAFAQSLGRLTTRRFVSDMLDTIVNFIPGSLDCEQRKPVLSVLCPGVQGAYRRSADAA